MFTINHYIISSVIHIIMRKNFINLVAQSHHSLLLPHFSSHSQETNQTPSTDCSHLASRVEQLSAALFDLREENEKRQRERTEERRLWQRERQQLIAENNKFKTQMLYQQKYQEIKKMLVLSQQNCLRLNKKLEKSARIIVQLRDQIQRGTSGEKGSVETDHQSQVNKLKSQMRAQLINAQASNALKLQETLRQISSLKVINQKGRINFQRQIDAQLQQINSLSSQLQLQRQSSLYKDNTLSVLRQQLKSLNKNIQNSTLQLKLQNQKIYNLEAQNKQLILKLQNSCQGFQIVQTLKLQRDQMQFQREKLREQLEEKQSVCRKIQTQMASICQKMNQAKQALALRTQLQAQIQQLKKGLQQSEASSIQKLTSIHELRKALKESEEKLEETMQALEEYHHRVKVLQDDKQRISIQRAKLIQSNLQQGQQLKGFNLKFGQLKSSNQSSNIQIELLTQKLRIEEQKFKALQSQSQLELNNQLLFHLNRVLHSLTGKNCQSQSVEEILRLVEEAVSQASRRQTRRNNKDVQQ